jgi:hypothetical protein
MNQIPTPKKLMPPDFPMLARTMSVTGAQKYWKTTGEKIREWATELGDGCIEAMRQNGAWASKGSGTGASQRSMRRIAGTSGSFREPEDVRALKHLQRATRWSCYSSRVYGETKDIMYHVGNRKLSLGELIELAERHGFER